MCSPAGHQIMSDRIQNDPKWEERGVASKWLGRKIAQHFSPYSRESKFKVDIALIILVGISITTLFIQGIWKDQLSYTENVVWSSVSGGATLSSLASYAGSKIVYKFQPSPPSDSC